MQIFTRKKSPFYWFSFSVRGQRVRQSTGILATPENREKAQEYGDKKKAEYWDRLKKQIVSGPIWQQAVIEFIKKTRNKKDHTNDKRKLKFLDSEFANVALVDIDSDFIRHAIREKTKFDDDGEPSAHNPTANRYIALVSAVLHVAKAKGLLDSVPTIEKFGEDKKRIRWITPDEAARLIAELNKTAPHLAAMADFTLSTGLREANCRLLTWSQVDMVRRVAWIYGDQAKGRRDFTVPLNDDALAVLREQKGKDSNFVFVYRGKPVGSCSTRAWKEAKQRANIVDFRWHDLRHTWASWHVQAGTSLQELMELGDWRSFEMVLRYAHLNADHLADRAARINRGSRKPALKLVK